jgi:hypothetical protein
MEKNVLLEGLRTPKPPAKFQNVCLKTFCGVRATRQLEDFNVLHAGNVLCAGVFIVRAGFRSPLFRFAFLLAKYFVASWSMHLSKISIKFDNQIWGCNWGTMGGSFHNSNKWDNYSTTLITMAIYPF